MKEITKDELINWKRLQALYTLWIYKTYSEIKKDRDLNFVLLKKYLSLNLNNNERNNSIS